MLHDPTKKADIVLGKGQTTPVNEKVSIITPCYQHGRYLASAAQSALDQSYSNLEIIIVNDGSSDSTPEVAETLSKRHPRRIAVIHQPNQGQAQARQTGLRHSTGDFIVMLDADDLLEPDMVMDSLRVFGKTPEADAVVGDALLVAEDGHSVIQVYRKRKISDWPGILVSNPCGAPFALMTRSASIRQIGGFAVGNPYGCEDWDLWARMSRCGMKFIRSRKIFGRYRQTRRSFSRQALPMLKGAITLLERASNVDPRLAGFQRKVAPPIAPAEYQRLRNGQVFQNLGVAFVSQSEYAEFEEILQHLVPGNLDAELCGKQFAAGVRFSSLAFRPESVQENLPCRQIVSLIGRHLEESGFGASRKKLIAGLSRALDAPRDKNSLFRRVRNGISGPAGELRSR